MKDRCSSYSIPGNKTVGMFQYKEGGSGIVYKHKEYSCASDALEAYMLDFEKKQKYYSKNKYEKEVQDLLCPKAKTETSSWFSHGKAETESSIANIVRESYRRLEQANRKAVQNSVSASVMLMQRLENDRLPSPTRSMAPGARLSTGSTDTNTLLDALPMVPSFTGNKASKNKPYQSQEILKNSSSNKSLGPSSASYNPAGVSSVNDITGKASKSHSSLHASANGPVPKQQKAGVSDSLHSLSKRDGTTSQRSRSQLATSDLVNSTQRSIERLDERANRAPSSLKPKAEWVSDGGFAGDLSGLSHDSREIDKGGAKSIPDSSIQSTLSAGSSLKAAGNRKHDGKGARHGLGKNLQGSFIDGAESDGATSSIITGHLAKGALPPKGGFTKVSSTPKRVPKGNQGTKQLRFDLETTKSSIGQGLELNDLNTRQVDADHRVVDEASLDLSQVQSPGTPVKADAAGDGFVNAGILKNLSLDRSRGPSSRVSFTTDDLLTYDPSGQTDTRPRSSSLPRVTSSDPSLMLDGSGMHILKNPFDRSEEFDTRHSLLGKGKEELNGSRASRSETSLRDIKESKYREFLKGLMADIDDSASSVMTTRETPLLHTNPGVLTASLNQHNAGGGYLERIQKLLSGVPSVSEFIKSDESQDSLSTEALLEGDRPWEARPNLRMPKAAPAATTEAPARNMCDDFMAECLADTQQPSESPVGGSGPLEALKNMLFTVQSLGTNADREESEVGSQPASECGDVADLPLNDSISKLLSPETKKLLSSSYAQGAPSLNKAMEHLTKLKDLVHHNTEEVCNEEMIEDDIL